MATDFTQVEIRNAVYSIEGYYLPTPHEELSGRKEAAFERAKAEAIRNYKRTIAALESINFEKFTKGKKCLR